jgi:hypothetical protein
LRVDGPRVLLLPGEHYDCWGPARYGGRQGGRGAEERRRHLLGAGAGTHRGGSRRRGCRRSATGATGSTGAAETTGATRTTRAAESVRMHHRVMLVVVSAVVTGVLAKDEAGEEDDRDDEDDPGDDRDPGRDLEDPGGPVWRCLCFDRRRRSCGRGPHSGGVRCFTHETHDAGVNNGDGYAVLKYQL